MIFKMDDILRNLLTLSLIVFLPACSPGATLFPVGEVNICPGDTRVFTCQVSMANTGAHIEWLIQFEAPDLSDIIQSYILADHPGDAHIDARSGYTFTFNLTSNNTLNFMSTLTVVVDPNTMVGPTLFSTATVDCNQANESARLHIATGSPSPPMNLIGVQTSGHHSNLKQNLITLLQWNASEAADFYIITVSPSVVGSAAGSSIITSNTTIEFPVLYNQEYNISVVASNCAGNSTPAEIMILIVPSDCGSSIKELTFMSNWISDTCSTTEGSTINIHCNDGWSANLTLVSVCSSEGKWKQESAIQALWPSRNTSTSGPRVPSHNIGSSFPPHYSLPIGSGFSFILGLLFGVLLTVCIMKLQAQRKASSLTTQDQRQMPLQPPVYEELCVQAAALEHTSPGCKVTDNVAYGPVCN